MVECSNAMPAMNNLDSVFGSLADTTRRDILRRVAGCEMSIGEIAQHYDLTFAAISKHIKILEKAQLIVKRRRGKEIIVTLAPGAFRDADEYLDWYRQRMEQRFDALEEFLQRDKRKSK
jgi:DNA-binding transcriptional ArsR family regulator